MVPKKPGVSRTHNGGVHEGRIMTMSEIYTGKREVKELNFSRIQSVWAEDGNKVVPLSYSYIYG